jgi:hypothetical protein
MCTVASGFWGLLGRPASEYGRLCRGGGGPRTGRASPEGASVAYGHGGHEGGDRRRGALMLAILVCFFARPV